MRRVALVTAMAAITACTAFGTTMTNVRGLQRQDSSAVRNKKRMELKP